MWLKPGDTYPPLRFDTNADLTGALSMVAELRRVHTTQMIEYTLVAAVPADGIMQYDWVTGDTDVAGTYQVRAVVTFADGTIQTFPQRNHLELIIGEG